MNPLRIVIPGSPVPWDRAGVQGKHFYTRPAYAAWKAKARTCMAIAMRGRAPLTDALCVNVDTFYARGGKPRVRKPRRAEPKPTRPDVDNLLKAPLDAGNGILWVDDGQIVQIAGAKWWASDGEEGRVIVTVTCAGGVS